MALDKKDLSGINRILSEKLDDSRRLFFFAIVAGFAILITFRILSQEETVVFFIISLFVFIIGLYILWRSFSRAYSGLTLQFDRINSKYDFGMPSKFQQKIEHIFYNFPQLKWRDKQEFGKLIKRKLHPLMLREFKLQTALKVLEEDGEPKAKMEEKITQIQNSVKEVAIQLDELIVLIVSWPDDRDKKELLRKFAEELFIEKLEAEVSALTSEQSKLAAKERLVKSSKTTA